MNKITCICLGVRSMEKAIRFYRDGLGFKTDCKEEVNKTIELVKSAGGTIVKEPQEVFWGGYHAYFADLDGYYWEVAWGPDFKYDEDGLLQF